MDTNVKDLFMIEWITVVVICVDKSVEEQFMVEWIARIWSVCNPLEYTEDYWNPSICAMGPMQKVQLFIRHQIW